MMRRTTPLRRSSPLPRGETPNPKRGSGLTRTTPIRKRNPQKGSRFPKRRDPAYCAWIRTLGCLCAGQVTESDGPFLQATDYHWFNDGDTGWCGPTQIRIVPGRECGGRVECAHVRTRGAGANDRGETVPLCLRHHRQQHAIGIDSFQLLYSLDLPQLAAKLATEYPGSAHLGAPTP